MANHLRVADFGEDCATHDVLFEIPKSRRLTNDQTTAAADFALRSVTARRRRTNLPGDIAMPNDITRRRLLQVGAGAGLGAALGSSAAVAANASSPDLSGVTLRVAFYKGAHKTLLETAGLAATPYKIEWKEFNSGVQHLEGINVDALDIGSGSETAASFSARSNA